MGKSEQLDSNLGTQVYHNRENQILSKPMILLISNEHDGHEDKKQEDKHHAMQ